MSGRPSWKSAEIGLFRPFSAFFALFRRVRRAPGKSRKRRKKAFFLRYPQICLSLHLLNPHLRHSKKCSKFWDFGHQEGQTCCRLWVHTALLSCTVLCATLRAFYLGPSGSLALIAQEARGGERQQGGGAENRPGQKREKGGGREKRKEGKKEKGRGREGEQETRDKAKCRTTSLSCRQDKGSTGTPHPQPGSVKKREGGGKRRGGSGGGNGGSNSSSGSSGSSSGSSGSSGSGSGGTNTGRATTASAKAAATATWNRMVACAGKRGHGKKKQTNNKPTKQKPTDGETLAPVVDTTEVVTKAPAAW